MGRVGQKIKGFFQKVGRGIKKAAAWVADKGKRIGKCVWKGVKWAARNVVPIVTKVVWAVTGGAGTVGKIAKAAGAIGEVIGGKAGNRIQQGSGKVEQFAGKVGDKAGQIGGVVTDKAERIKKIVHNTAQSVSTA